MVGPISSAPYTSKLIRSTPHRSKIYPPTRSNTESDKTGRNTDTLTQLVVS